jgi:hypothetical protein
VSGPEIVLYGITPLLWHEQIGISSVLVNELRLAGFPDLAEGKIQFGEKALRSRRAPPSIVCMWEGSAGGGTQWGKEIPRPSSVRLQPVINSLGTDAMRLAFYCWAEAYPPDPESARDADAARYLAHQLWRVIHRMAEGSYRPLGIDTSLATPTQVGFQAVLRVELATPVPDNLLAYVLPGSRAALTVQSETGEVAATITTKGSM